MKQFVAVIAIAWSALAFAQAYPTKPVKFIVPYPPGGGTDLVARALGQQLGEALGQPFIIENRPGASEIIGTEAVVRSPADGHTLLLMSNTLAINSALDQKLPYDAARDLSPVTRLVNVPFALLLHPSVGVTTVPELVAMAKANPGRLNGGHIGIGTPHFLTLQWFNMVTRADITPVPYKGAGPAITALIAGEVQLMFAGMGGATPHIKAGRLKPIAVTSARRVPSAASLPTIAEAGYPEIDMTAWYGVMVPSGTPPEVIEKLNKAFERALTASDVAPRFASAGMEAAPNKPAEFGRLIQEETRNWRRVVRATGVKAQIQ